MGMSFDSSSAISSEFGIFGLPFTEDQSRVVLLPVPWEVTTSYGEGASLGPQLVRLASEQIDLFDLETGKAYETGFFMREFPHPLKTKNDLLKEKAQKVIRLRTQLSDDIQQIENLTNEVNEGCAEMTRWVRQQSREILLNGKKLGLVGGDHSTPWGAIQAVSEIHQGDFGVLHFDAHADLREAYQGFHESHASIMFNVMNHASRPKKLVQVGVRDFCSEEFDLIESRSDIKTFFDLHLKRRLFQGETWAQITDQILSELPEKVYISFDIDGLDPTFCPATGTPVPGGLSVDQAFYIFSELHRKGHKIVGFDLNEVSTGGLALDEADEWDGNVGARVLYKLCGWAALS